MQKSFAFSSYTVFNENTGCRNIITLILIFSPIILFNSDSSTAVFGQVERQNLIITDSDSLICQIVDGNKSLIGSNYQQASNICEHQNSIGSIQALAELCYIFSDNTVDDISASCKVEEASNPAMIPTEPEINITVAGQNNTGDPLKITIFDGVSDFLSNLFNP